MRASLLMTLVGFLALSNFAGHDLSSGRVVLAASNMGNGNGNGNGNIGSNNGNGNIGNDNGNGNIGSGFGNGNTGNGMGNGGRAQSTGGPSVRSISSGSLTGWFLRGWSRRH